MPIASPEFAASEIFKFVRIKRPEILDMEQRALNSGTYRAVWKKSPAQKQRWAQSFIKSDQVVSRLSDLSVDYLKFLKLKELPRDFLPTRKDIRDRAEFMKQSFSEQAAYQEDIERCLGSVIAFQDLDGTEQQRESALIYGFVIAFPSTAQRQRRQPYAHAVFSKLSAREIARQEADKAGKKQVDKSTPVAPDPDKELPILVANLDTLWELRNRLVSHKENEHSKRFEEFSRESRELSQAASMAKKKPSGKAPKAAPKPTLDKRASARLKTLRDGVIAAKHSYNDAIASFQQVDALLAISGKELAGVDEDRTEKAVIKLQKQTRELLQKYQIKSGSFHDTFAEAQREIDERGLGRRHEVAPAGCFGENPAMKFNQTLQMLGHADLIKIHENFIRYIPSEISYIENILPGEIRKRELKSTKYFEQLSETLSEEVIDKSQETILTTKSDLASSVESEFNSRMDSDINSSFSGSGGGTIGVVDLEGSASAAASVGLGVDSSFSTQNSSNFSQEIINKAVEKTKSTLIEKRVNRTYSLYESLNSHEIDNSEGDDPQSRTGIYCFLDKQVCLTETVYGKRLFLTANIPLPAKNLLCERRLKHGFALEALGEQPLFDISVDDIQPNTYKTYVTRYRAQNIEPPPPPVQIEGRVYKTDTSNANVKQQEFKARNVAEILSPFFEQYKRFLITDMLELPEGYMLREVFVTVNHGHNGISIPTHLPLKVTGAAAGTALTMASGLTSGLLGPAVLVPFGSWQFLFSASPFMHYNTDSSNVTVCIGNQFKDSPYFFFEPEVLMDQLINTMGQFAANAPELLDQLKQKATTLGAELTSKAIDLPVDIAGMIEGAIRNLVTNIEKTLKSISIGGNLRDGLTATFGNIAQSIVDMQALSKSLGELFNPLKEFVSVVVNLFEEGLINAMADFFAILQTQADNSQMLHFAGQKGLRTEVPVSINAVAVNPGITVNLVAILERTPEALERWRLDTFEKLYQAYLQLEAEFESKQLSSGNPVAVTRNPASMRHEEQQAVKELVLYSLNNLHTFNGNNYSLERMQLFESSIDWKNLSYRLYNYGPNLPHILMEKEGLFSGVDERRRAFQTALWAQVMIPVQADVNLESLIGQYFLDGTFDFTGEFENADELTALLQNLVLERSLVEEDPIVTPLGKEIIPTDLILVRDDLPENPDDTLCDLD